MRLSPEHVYRNHLVDSPGCLTTALDSLVPPDPSNDDPLTRLTRELCFEPAQYDDAVRPSLSESLPHMLDHGLRQVALSQAVLASENVRERLPEWFDVDLFGRALLVADAGLTFVPRKEVHEVHEFGPKAARLYTMHPEFGYGMAEALRQPDDPKSKMLSLLIARHHAIQARHAYGPEWHELDSAGVNQSHIDLTILLQKPPDYFDDYFGRPGTPFSDFAEQARAPTKRFTETFGSVLCNNLLLVADMEREGFDPALPNIVAAEILKTVMRTDGEPGGISEAYRQLRPDLVRPNSAPVSA